MGDYCILFTDKFLAVGLGGPIAFHHLSGWLGR